MGRAYSDDLRGRVIEAAHRLGSASAAAAQFSVSRSTAIKWMQAERSEGRRSAKPGRGRPREALAPYADWLLARHAEADDLTLAEWRDALWEAHGVRVCLSTIWCFFDRRGYKRRGANARASRPV